MNVVTAKGDLLTLNTKIASISIIIAFIFFLFPVGSVYGESRAETQYFSVQLPDSWVYKQDFAANDSLLLVPSELTGLVDDDDTSKSLLNLAEKGVLIEFGRDVDYHPTNNSLEKYSRYFLNSAQQNYDPEFGNATLGGERATKILINGTEVGKYGPMKNITGSINTIAYLVVHHNQPYYLYYIANENNYIKYLNDFEQIVSNFRFTK